MVQRICKVEAHGIVVQRHLDVNPVFYLYMGEGE